MAAIEGESVEEDFLARNRKIAVRFLAREFSLCTNAKNKPVRRIKNRFSEHAFLSGAYSLLLLFN